MLREFALTVSIAILVSGFLSLTLTPMLCSRLLKAEAHHRENLFGRILEASFQALLSGYRGNLRFVLKHHFATLLVTFATVAGTVYAYRAIPKGFFPPEDTGLIAARTQGLQGISFPDMVERQVLAVQIIRADPAVRAVNSIVGDGAGPPLINSGAITINLKPFEERRGTSVAYRLAKPSIRSARSNGSQDCPQR
jgi:HAE1 family hydrophobic/amphiphilic exporter-1